MRKKLVTAIASILLFLGATFVQADYSAGETPRDALSEILELYKSKNWEGVVRERCLDTQHVGSVEAVKGLVEHLEYTISSDDVYHIIVRDFEAALVSRLEFKSEGNVAVFSSARGSVTLSKMDTGAWGLRL